MPPMPLSRVLEPEVMDSPEEASAYDAMDHGGVNAAFCADLLALSPAPDLARVLDVGTGTSLIPIELCRRHPGARVVGIDLAPSMLEVGRRNVERAALSGVVSLGLADAKALAAPDGAFSCVISNSIIHHIPDPLPVLRGALRVLASGGWLFVRDLLRPADEATVRGLVATHAADDTPSQRALFDASLRAALDLGEVRRLAADAGMAGATIEATSDRHWTLAFRKAA
jgi:ubiquinone/menaquinone biosynthesis C-methylase UbiE